MDGEKGVEVDDNNANAIFTQSLELSKHQRKRDDQDVCVESNEWPGWLAGWLTRRTRTRKKFQCHRSIPATVESGGDGLPGAKQGKGARRWPSQPSEASTLHCSASSLFSLSGSGEWSVNRVNKEQAKHACTLKLCSTAAIDKFNPVQLPQRDWTGLDWLGQQLSPLTRDIRRR
ncbi:hypothetical protein DL95DRAFT_404723 [Leptodontidium sp. 2 PMI_412]|nr:hypothetical protein DL95DRAFT_404723 [Leptodontidium sp. 2 PMI_412]